VSAPRYPIWMFVVVALAIALAGFGVAQWQPGSGMMVVAVAATLWVAFVQARAIKKKSNG
jgi:hypothetical protein